MFCFALGILLRAVLLSLSLDVCFVCHTIHIHTSTYMVVMVVVVSGNGDLKIGCLLFHLLSHPNHHLSSQHFSCRSPPPPPQPPHTPPHHPRLLPICPSSIFYRCWLPHLPGLSLSRKLLNPAWNDWLLFVVGGVDDWPGDVLVDLLMLPEVFGVAT